MKIKKRVIMTLLLTMGAGLGLYAQTAVTVGNQVTSVDDLVSGKAYLLRWDGLGGTPYALDNGSTYAMANNNSPTTAGVYYLIKDGGSWKVENAFTGLYWGTPSANADMPHATAASAGSWTIASSSMANRFTFTCTNGSAYHTNRSSSKLVAHTTDSPVSIYEVTTPALSNTLLSALAGYDISVSATAATSFTEGQWYVVKNQGLDASDGGRGYIYENQSTGTFYNTATAPSGSAADNAKYLVRLLSAGSGKYYLQTGYGNYMGAINTTDVPAVSLGSSKLTVAKINNTDGHFYFQNADDNTVLDAVSLSGGDAKLVGWGTDAPTSVNYNNDWAFYPVEFVNSWAPTASEVYTINNTNPSRGALIYNPAASTTHVWSSGKSGTFNASQANSQWVIYPTGTDGQYYLYNVGAQKFAVPSGNANGASNPWVFSNNAVAVTFITQSDGTRKIKMAKDPVHGTNDAYLAVSNGQTYPIINYNDVGGNFTITKVDGADESAAATTAVSNLIINQTPLSAVPTGEGWYAIRVKTHATYADQYVFTREAEATHNSTSYPLGFYSNVNVLPFISDAAYFVKLTKSTYGHYFQMPNGLYIQGSGKPISGTGESSVSISYDATNHFIIKSGNNFWQPYYLSNDYFIGETGTTGTTYFDIYPVDLDNAGLVAWQIVCDGAPESTKIACLRSDVSGLASVYKNGYIFLPTGVTPQSTDFTLDGATRITVDATAHTVTFEYDPNLAIVADGVEVSQGWQTAGRGSEVMLLRVNATPFADATGAALNVSLLDGAESNISALTLYEASSDSPEILSAGNSGAPTKTQVATTSVSGSTATLAIGNLTTGSHYYWLGATVKSTATLGAVIDAAVTGITYTHNNNETTLDLTATGNPSDRGAMVFNVHSYPFLPWDNGSRVYRIPAMVVADDGSIITAADKRYGSHTDIGGGHVIDIVVRRSTDGGKTWDEPVIIAKGDNSNDATCGYGDPSLIKGKDGKIYCFFAAGNTGYFYGLNRICMSVSTDNGATWSSSAANPPADLVSAGKVTDHATSYGADTCYGLYDYFVTSGRGLCTSEGYLMGLLPAQPYTNAEKTAHTSNSQNYIFYSTDQGATWHISENAIYTAGDEAKIIQANDGSLIASIRQGNGRGFNTATYTYNEADGTLAFTMGTQYQNTQLYNGGNANNQDILYYQRTTETGKTDVIFHSMTTGTHANLKLYYSTDGGANWTEFLNVQTKGTRYVTMDKSSTGSLYLLFEDQSLNAAGNNSDTNHYPINFLEITRDQLEALIPELDKYSVKVGDEVKIVYGTTGETTYGSWSDLTWTSNAASGVAGLTLTLSGGSHDKFSSLNSRYNMAYHPASANTNATIMLTAPTGYVITGYSAETGVYQTSTYTVTPADGSPITPANLGSTYTPLSVTGLNAASTTITINTTDASKWLTFTNFTVTLAKTFPLKVVGDASYATLYLPFDVKTADASTKAYYVASAADGAAQLTELENGEIPANTAVLLINSEGAATTTFTTTSGLTSVVSESANLLKGTLVPLSLDLGDGTNFYSLGQKSSQIGFYKFDDGDTTTITLGANKAYLDTSAQSSSAKGFVFTLDDPTAVASIVNESTTVNGQWYTLDGRKLSGEPSERGIYINAGKKVLKK